MSAPTLLLLGFIAGVACDAWGALLWAWIASRRPKRVGPDQRSYHDPCGPGCTVPR